MYFNKITADRQKKSVSVVKEMEINTPRNKPTQLETLEDQSRHMSMKAPLVIVPGSLTELACAVRCKHEYSARSKQAMKTLHTIIVISKNVKSVYRSQEVHVGKLSSGSVKPNETSVAGAWLDDSKHATAGRLARTCEECVSASEVSGELGIADDFDAVLAYICTINASHSMLHKFPITRNNTILHDYLLLSFLKDCVWLVNFEVDQYHECADS